MSTLPTPPPGPDPLLLLKSSEGEEKTISHLLVIIIDLNPAQKYLRDDPLALAKVVDALIAFGNAHVLKRGGNQVAFYAATTTDSHMLYPLEKKSGEDASIPIHQVDAQFEKFLHLEVLMRKNISAVILQDVTISHLDTLSTDSGTSSSYLASGILKALCYINYKERQVAVDEKLVSRILVVSGSCESTSQYMASTNAFFAAQKQGVTIDACILGKYATLLNQGADITGGIYFKPPQGPAGLLQYLMWIFLPEVSLRKELALPPSEPVDYRAACFCHRKLISEGYVCSVCLSIFCSYLPVCTTCFSTFKIPQQARPLQNRKPAS